MSRSSLWIILLLALAGCTKEEITSRKYPRLVTQEVTNITSAGVVLHGEITFTSVDIIDHGFLWSKSGFPSLDNSTKISLGSKSGIGIFQASIDSGMEIGKTYYVRVYARSADYLVYGDVVKFVSLGP